MIATILHLTGLWIASIFIIATKTDDKDGKFYWKIFWIFKLPSIIYIAIWLFVTFSKLVNFLNQ